MSSSLVFSTARALRFLGCDAIEPKKESFARTLGFIVRRIVLFDVEFGQHAKVAGQHVEHWLLVVHLDAVDFLRAGRGDDFGDRRNDLVAGIDLGREDALGTPFDDVSDLGKADPSAFLKHPLLGDTEARGARRDILDSRRPAPAPMSLAHSPDPNFAVWLSFIRSIWICQHENAIYRMIDP